MIGGADGRGDWGACDPGRAAQPPHARQHRHSRRGQGALLVDTAAGHAGAAAGLRDRAQSMRSCYTHAHADHITGLDDVRLLNRIVDRPLDAFGTAGDAWRADASLRLCVPALGAAGLLPAGAGAAAGEPGRNASTRPGCPCGCSTRITASSARLDCASAASRYSTDVVRSGRGRLRRAGRRRYLGGRLLPARAAPHACVAGSRARLGRAPQPRRTVLTHMGTDMDWRWLTANLPEGRRTRPRRPDPGNPEYPIA